MSPYRPSGAYPARYGPALLVAFLLFGVPIAAYALYSEGFSRRALLFAGFVLAGIIALWPARKEHAPPRGPERP